MSLPLGHAAVGITIAELVPGKKTTAINWKHYLFFALLANLPDSDIIIGLLFNGNGNLFHRGMTHSLLFTLVSAFLASRAWKLLWPGKPVKTGFITCFLVIFSHITADILFTGSPVSLFWPFEIYRSGGYKGWLDIMHIVVFKIYRDAALITGSTIIFFLNRWMRQTSPLNLTASKRISS